MLFSDSVKALPQRVKVLKLKLTYSVLKEGVVVVRCGKYGTEGNSTAISQIYSLQNCLLT